MAGDGSGRLVAVGGRDVELFLPQLGATDLIVVSDLPGPDDVDGLRAAFDAGATICGVGAAAPAVFESGVTTGPDGPRLVHGRGLLPLSVCPFHDRPDVAGAYYGFISRHLVPRGYGVDDGAAVMIDPAGRATALRGRRGAHVYAVEHVAGEVILKGVWADAQS